MRVGAILLLVEILSAVPAAAATVSDGKSAYSQNRLSIARQILMQVANDAAASAADRSEAQRELARIAWLIDADERRALAYLEAARAAGGKPCDTAAMTARVLRESTQARLLVQRSPDLLADCPEASGDDKIRTHLVAAEIDLAITNPVEARTWLARATSDSRDFSPDANFEAPRVRLEAALLNGDAAGALAAWKDYFWLDEGDAPQALASLGVTKILSEGLRPAASADERLKLAELLMRAGFARESKRFADLHRLGAQVGGSIIYRRLQAYWAARDALQTALLRANRMMANQGKTEAAIKRAGADLDSAEATWRKTLLDAAGIKGEAEDVLARAYGILGTGRGTTSGYPSIHRGHIIEDREMVIRQHGKTAKIHYVAVDNMISNGFESWLWDGGPMVGAWQGGGKIVSVRPAYVNSPIDAYRLTQDSSARRQLIERESKNSKEDLAKLQARPIATLEGLKDRLRLQLVDRVAAAARSRVSNEGDFRKGFLAEFSRANFNQSVEVHEGRHAIDESLGLSGKVEQPVIEYQAKLSELALAIYPRMALRNMILNLEGHGPHDKAGARVLGEYRKWMEANSAQVVGYDPALPALVQLDKLTDSQLREIALSLDPLPNGRQSPAKL